MIISIISKVAGNAKGRAYEIDPQTRVSDLGRVVLGRSLMLIRGRIRFSRRKHTPFIGSHVKLIGKRHVKFGAGLTVDDNALINAVSANGVSLGRNVTVGRNTCITGGGNLRHLARGMTVGDRVGLGTDNLFGYAGGISIGDDTIFGNYVSIHAENHVTKSVEIPIHQQGTSRVGVTIGAGCWIGSKVTILDGAILGDRCIIAAGSVVTSGVVPPAAIYGGVPAKLIRTRIPDDPKIGAA